MGFHDSKFSAITCVSNATRTLSQSEFVCVSLSINLRALNTSLVFIHSFAACRQTLSRFVRRSCFWTLFLKDFRYGRSQPETLLRLAELVLTLNCFSFADNHYKQVNGVAMGTKMGPTITATMLKHHLLSSVYLPPPPYQCCFKTNENQKKTGALLCDSTLNKGKGEGCFNDLWQ